MSQLQILGRGGTQNLAQTRKGKKTAGKDFRESAQTPVGTKFDKKVRKCEGEKASILQKAQ